MSEVAVVRIVCDSRSLWFCVLSEQITYVVGAGGGLSHQLYVGCVLVESFFAYKWLDKLVIAVTVLTERERER